LSTKNAKTTPSLPTPVIAALHTNSHITNHPRREILLLYYDISVRYGTILKLDAAANGQMLMSVFESLCGTKGLLNDQSGFRNKCAYVMLRLVKSIGAEVGKYVENIVAGIQRKYKKFPFISITHSFDRFATLSPYYASPCVERIY